MMPYSIHRITSLDGAIMTLSVGDWLLWFFFANLWTRVRDYFHWLKIPTISYWKIKIKKNIVNSVYVHVYKSVTLNNICTKLKQLWCQNEVSQGKILIKVMHQCWKLFSFISLFFENLITILFVFPDENGCNLFHFAGKRQCSR